MKFKPDPGAKARARAYMNEDREGQRKAGGLNKMWRWRKQWKERVMSQVEEERTRWRRRERKGRETVPSRAIT